MKTLLMLIIILMCESVISAELNAYDLTQSDLHSVVIEASNVYDAVNQVMMKGIEQDARLRRLRITIGPFKPRNKDKRLLKLNLEKATVWDLLRYSAEHFSMRLTYKDDAITLDENWEEKFDR